MKEIVEWLIGIERMAGTLYRDAEIFFKKDTDLSAFLHEVGRRRGLAFSHHGQR